MNIRSIDSSDFNRFLPGHFALESLMGDVVELFSNRSGTLLGAIATGQGVAGWNYVIFKLDKNGEVHVRKVMSNFFNLKAARVDLLLSMAGIESAKSAHRGVADSWSALPPAKSVASPVEAYCETERITN